jgi:hypothetical protein
MTHGVSKNLIPYFGYGANRDPEMMEAIIGRVPDGEFSLVSSYDLAIQLPHEIPDHVRSILAIHRTPEEVASFSTYVMRSKTKSLVNGMLWYVSAGERELIDNWELNDGTWYSKVDVCAARFSGVVRASTEVIEDTTLTVAEDIAPNLPNFLNPKDRLLEVARIVRLEYLDTHRSVG